MKYKKLGNVIAIRFDPGDEISEGISYLCKENNIIAGIISGIGTTDNAIIGAYDLESKSFGAVNVTDFYEISNLCGNVSTLDGNIYLHLHGTLGDKKGKVYAGHLQSAVVAATAEVFVIPLDGEISRRKDNYTGLNIFDF